MIERSRYHKLDLTSVIKLGPDRPVQLVEPKIGPIAGPISLLDQKCIPPGADVIDSPINKI